MRPLRGLVIFGLVAIGALPLAGCSSDHSSDQDADVEEEADAAGDAGNDSPDVSPDARPDVPLDVPPDAPDGDGPRDAREVEFDPGDIPCPDPDAGYDADAPGVWMFFNVGTTLMMGQFVGNAAGGFRLAAREDWNAATTAEIPLDTCVVDGPATPIHECEPGCTPGTTDCCAPEQQCVQDTDGDGNPIAGSGVCHTTRTALDVGPFTAEGFATPQTFAFNAAQSGAYLSTGDGTMPPEEIIYDSDYTFSGNGDPAQGLGRFAGWLHLAPEITLTSPEPVFPGGGAIPQINIDPTAALPLAWTGGDPSCTRLMSINLAGATLSGGGGSVSCNVRDDGEFTIPAEDVSSITFGNYSFLNVLTLRRDAVGTACGEGLSRAEVNSQVVVLMNVGKTRPPADAGTDAGDGGEETTDAVEDASDGDAAEPDGGSDAGE